MADRNVKLKGDAYECDCPGYRFRRKECKHIKEIKKDGEEK